MALERKTLRAILEDETTDTSGKLKKILDVLHEETDTLLDKYADRVVRLSGEDIDKLELDDKGEVKDAKKHADSLKADWSDFVGTTTTTGAKVDNPPTNTGSKMTKDQIFAIKDAGERQAAIAANADLFTGGGKD